VSDDEADNAVVSLARWASAAKADDAADARTRERWLRQQAQESATVAGLMAGLVERRVAVALRTTNGHTHNGTLVGVGADYLALVGANRMTFVPLDRVATVTPRPPTAAPASDERQPPTGRLAAVLAGLAAEGPPVTLMTGGETVAGVLAAVGADLLTIQRGDAAGGEVLYVPVASVAELSVRLSG
jgi:hypothetical protein